MRRALVGGLVALQLALAGAAFAQTDPVLGNWRGTIQSGQGPGSPIIITVFKKGDVYAGSTTGLGEGAEAPIEKITVSGNRVSFEGTAPSKLGLVTLAGEFSVEGNAMKGAGTLAVGGLGQPVTFDLRRRGRQDVAQHQVPQGAEYFRGRWKFEYVGGEFPPLSQGGRTGTLTFSASPTASGFLTGTVEGDAFGKAYKETVVVGVNADTKTVVYQERRSDGVELVSLGNWTSPLAIVFQTSLVQAGGRAYQLRRVMSVLSETSFDVTEEFSVDGGAFRRLGSAHYSKLP